MRRPGALVERSTGVRMEERGERRDVRHGDAESTEQGLRSAQPSAHITPAFVAFPGRAAASRPSRMSARRVAVDSGRQLPPPAGHGPP